MPAIDLISGSAGTQGEPSVFFDAGTASTTAEQFLHRSRLPPRPGVCAGSNESGLRESQNPADRLQSWRRIASSIAQSKPSDGRSSSLSLRPSIYQVTANIYDSDYFNGLESVVSKRLVDRSRLGTLMPWVSRIARRSSTSPNRRMNCITCKFEFTRMGF